MKEIIINRKGYTAKITKSLGIYKAVVVSILKKRTMVSTDINILKQRVNKFIDDN